MRVYYQLANPSFENDEARAMLPLLILSVDDTNRMIGSYSIASAKIRMKENTAISKDASSMGFLHTLTRNIWLAWVGFHVSECLIGLLTILGSFICKSELLYIASAYLLLLTRS